MCKNFKNSNTSTNIYIAEIEHCSVSDKSNKNRAKMSHKVTHHLQVDREMFYFHFQNGYEVHIEYYETN